MISLSTEMIWRSVVISFALGVLFTFLYRLISRPFSHLCKNGKARFKLGKVLASVFEATYIILFGFLHILLNYVTCDGVLNIYTFLALFSGVLLPRGIIKLCQNMRFKHVKGLKKKMLAK